MKTITFYSYKGGVGRTLLLANIAKYLSRFGQKVFAIDFDLEAPGLHYKFGLSNSAESSINSKGLVDYIYSYSNEGIKPSSIQEFVVEVENSKGGGSIHLMPAGRVPTAKYWRQLAQINWHDLFYSDEARGIPFFIELKARIKKEYQADYLLIDSRTGITEIGGVATTILPEYVLCLLLRNRENLEGAREVLRSINRTLRLRDQKPITIVPVLTRLPVLEDVDEENRILAEVKAFLNQDAPELSDTLSVRDLPVLHTERSLEIEESLLIGNEGKHVEPSPLLRDYIQLFALIVPQEIIEPHLEPLIKEALREAWDDPNRTERDLLALTEYSTHPEPYRALLKFYRLRNVSKGTILKTACNYWEVSGKANESLLWNAVKDNFQWDSVYTTFGHVRSSYSDKPDKHPIPIRFIDEVWRAAGANDKKIGIELATAYKDLKNETLAVTVIEKILEDGNIPETPLLAILRLFSAMNRRDLGIEVARRYKDLYQNSNTFIEAFADLIVESKDPEGAAEILEFAAAHPGNKIERNVILYGKLLSLTGNADKLREVLLDAEPDWQELRYSSQRSIVEFGELFVQVGLESTFKRQLERTMPPEEAESVIREIRRRA